MQDLILMQQKVSSHTDILLYFKLSSFRKKLAGSITKKSLWMRRHHAAIKVRQMLETNNMMGAVYRRKRLPEYYYELVGSSKLSEALRVWLQHYGSWFSPPDAANQDVQKRQTHLQKQELCQYCLDGLKVWHSPQWANNVVRNVSTNRFDHPSPDEVRNRQVTRNWILVSRACTMRSKKKRTKHLGKLDWARTLTMVRELSLNDRQ